MQLVRSRFIGLEHEQTVLELGEWKDNPKDGFSINRNPQAATANAHLDPPHSLVRNMIESAISLVILRQVRISRTTLPVYIKTHLQHSLDLLLCDHPRERFQICFSATLFALIR